MLKFLKYKYTKLAADTRFSEILTGSAWAVGAQIIASIGSIITSIIIARWYGADILGIVAVLNSFLLLGAILTLLGTNISILRLVPEYLIKYSPTSAYNVYRKSQYFVIAVSLFTGCLLGGASGLVADFVFSKPHLQFYFALAAVSIVFMALMNFNTAAVRGIRLIRMFSFMQILPSISRLAILILITIFFYHRDNPIYAMFASIAITAVAGVWLMNGAFKKKMTINDTLHFMSMQEILRISMPMFMTSIMTFALGQTGVIMLGIFRTEAEVGYYSVAVRLATLTSFIYTSINSIAAPKFSELYHSDNIDELFYIAKKAAKLIFWTTSPILFFLILLGKPALSLLFGTDFQVAYLALVLLLLGQFVHSISGSTGIFMNMTGNHKNIRNFMLIASLINIMINLILIPYWGIIGAALAGTVSLMFWNICSLIYIKRKYGKTISYLPFLS